MLIACLYIVAALGLIGCGMAYGYRRALEVSEQTCANLRGQVAHLQGAPAPGTAVTKFVGGAR